MAGFERVFRRLAASGCIDESSGLAAFAVLAIRRNPSLSGLRQRFQTEPSVYMSFDILDAQRCA